jgi:hypothetical protein
MDESKAVSLTHSLAAKSWAGNPPDFLLKPPVNGSFQAEKCVSLLFSAWNAAGYDSCSTAFWLCQSETAHSDNVSI